MEKLADLFVKNSKIHNLKQEMDSAFVLKKLEQIIENQWGIKGKKNLHPQKIIFNQIYLKARNSAWSQEFQLQKHRILSQLNQTKLKKILEIKIML